jgi:hypothetical protein
MAKKRSAKKTSGKKKKTSAGRKPAKKKARKSARARRARPASRRLRSAVARTRSAAGEVAVLESTGARVQALQAKLDALTRLEDALRARRTVVGEDLEEIRLNLRSIANAKRAVEAQIVAAQTTVLAPPNGADITALRNAIRDAERAIAQNAAVNQLVRAATALIRTLNA